MSSNGLLPSAPKRSFRRVWLPWLIVGVPVIYIAGLWAWPGDNLVPASRRFGTNAAIAAAVLLLWAWGVWVSRYRHWFLLAGCVVAGILAATIEGLECDGDMHIIVRRRFDERRDDKLAAHRRSQKRPDGANVVTTSDRALDFPGYRGLKRDGIVTSPPLNRDWTARPPRCVWRQPIGGGYAQFAVAGNAAITIEQRGSDEAVVCYDTASGAERWQHMYPAQFTEVMGGEGPRATPTIVDGKVYSLGATGVLNCLDVASGDLLWSVNILEGKKNVRWGMSGSPLVVDNMVIVNPGSQRVGDGAAVLGYDRQSGAVVRATGDAPAGYSSPMLATLAGRAQIVLLDGRRVAGYSLENGDVLWSYDWETQYGINVAQPLILDGDRVFISAGYGMGGAMLQVSESAGVWTVSERWPKKLTMRCKFTSPVYYQGHIYGLDEGILACIDAETGERKWRDGRYGHGQLLLADDLLVILSESGKLMLVEATPDGLRQLGMIQAIEGAKTWNPLAIADGKVYVRNAEEMACYDLTISTPDS